MSVTASPALITASRAAATNERPTGNRRNSDVCDRNTRLGGDSLGITHSIPALTQREKPMAGARWDDARPGTGPSPTPAPVASSGRPVAQVAIDLAISEQTIYVWRRQHLIDTEQLPGTTSSENAELVAARRRIAELEAEVASHRRAAQLLGEVVSPKDGSRRSP